VSIELPIGWISAKLDDVVDVLDFEREPINSSERNLRVEGKCSSALFPYYGSTGQVGWIDGYQSDGERVLLGEDAAPFLDPIKDKAYLANGKFWVNNHAHVLIGTAGLVDNYYLCHQLNYVDYHPFVSGSTRLKLTSAAMKQIPLFIAPFAEQTRIVEKLEALLADLDAGIAELKAAQKKLGQYRQSLLKAAVEGALTAQWRKQHPPTETGAQLLERILSERRARWEAKQLAKFAGQGKIPPKDWQKKYPEPVQPDSSGLPELPVGWVWASIKQITSDEKYSLAIGPFGSNLKSVDYCKVGVPLVFVRNIRSGNYGGQYTKYVTSEKADELKAHSICAGDVLITKMGEPPGDADVYPDNQPPAIITADCIKVRCWTDLIRANFLKIVINSHIGQKQIEPITQGVAQKKVSLSRFTTLAIPVPSVQEQDHIMSLITEVNTKIVAQEMAISHSLKQSALQRKNILKAAFSGQLVPQDPNDEPASALLERIRNERATTLAAATTRPRKSKRRPTSAS